MWRFFFWFGLLGSECVFLKFFVYPVAKMLMKLLFSPGLVHMPSSGSSCWSLIVLLGLHFSTALCPIHFWALLEFKNLASGPQFTCQVVSRSCDLMFNFTCIMLQSHCEHVALLFFFWFWLLASECSYWRRFAYYCKDVDEVMIQPGVGSHASHWVLLFSSLLVLLGLDLFSCPLSHTHLYL